VLFRSVVGRKRELRVDRRRGKERPSYRNSCDYAT